MTRRTSRGLIFVNTVGQQTYSNVLLNSKMTIFFVINYTKKQIQLFLYDYILQTITVLKIKIFHLFCID